MLKEHHLPKGHVIVRANYVPWKTIVPGPVMTIRKEPETMDEVKAERENVKKIPGELMKLDPPSQILPPDYPEELVTRFTLVAFLSQTQSLCDIYYQDGDQLKEVRVHSLLFNAIAAKRPPETIRDILENLKVTSLSGDVSPLNLKKVKEISPFYFTEATLQVLCLIV